MVCGIHGMECLEFYIWKKVARVDMFIRAGLEIGNVK